MDAERKCKYLRNYDQNFKGNSGVFDYICHSLGHVSTFGLGSYNCYFQLSVVIEVSVFELAVIDSVRFAVGKQQIYCFFSN